MVTTPSRKQDPGGAVIAFPKLTKAQRKELLSGEMGTAFDLYTRLFVSYADGDVFDTGEWRARDMDQMLKRDGDAVMIEQALTLLPRGTTYGLSKEKGDTGEYDEIMAQLFQPSYSGGFSPGMQTVIGQLSEAAVYRKSFFEKQYELDSGGKVKLTKLAWRPPTTCDIARDEHTADFDGYYQRSWWFSPGTALKQTKPNAPPGNVTVGGKDYTGWIKIPKLRAYVYIHGAHRAPLTGVSEMDICYWCYKQKQKVLYLWFSFIEAQAHPKIAAYGATGDEGGDIANALASAKSSSVIGFERPPAGAKLFDIIESSGKGSTEFTAALSYLKTYQVNSILAGFLELGSAAALGRGTYALSESQTQFFLASRQAQLNEMVSSFTTDVIAPLCILNHGPDTVVPKLTAAPLTEALDSLVVSTLNALAVAPNLRVPQAYVDLVAEKAGQVLDLPADRVTAAIQEGAKQMAQQAAQTSANGASPQGQGAAKIAGATKTATKLARAILDKQFDPSLDLTRSKGYEPGWQPPSNNSENDSS